MIPFQSRTRAHLARLATALACAASLLAACGSGSGDFLVDTQPANLAYAAPAATYTTCVAIAPNTPTFDGVVDVFSVAPPLPAGLALDASSGALSGTPSAAAPAASYTVTASGPGGSANATLSIEVLAATPPSGLSYAVETAVYATGVPIAPNAPSVTGTASTWSVDPALPDGLSLDPATGVIGGVPAVATAEATYTVTAANCAGASAEVELSIAVEDGATVGGDAPRFLFVANEFDGTVSRLAIDAATRQARHAGWFAVAGAPRELATSPDGTRLFVLAHGTPPSVAVFHVAASGATAEVPGSPFALPAGSDPRGLAVGPAGSRLYVTLGALNQLAAFQVSGAGVLTAIAGSPIALPGTPRPVAVSSQGDRLFVGLASAESVVSLAITASGLPTTTGVSTQPLSANPRRLALVAGAGGQTFLLSTNDDPVSGASDTVTSVVVGSGGALTFAGFLNLGADVDPDGLAVRVFGSVAIAHVAVPAFDLVRRVSVDLSTGVPTAAGFVDVGESPAAVAFARDGSAGYVLYGGDLELASGRFDASGVWTAVGVGGTSFARTRTRPGARAVAIASGAATLAPTDATVYAANSDVPGDVSQFDFERASDTLVPLSPPTVAAGDSPSWLAAHPLLARVYCADRSDPGGADLRVFPVGTGGALGTPTLHELGDVAAGDGVAWAVVVEPGGHFLYAIRSDTVSEAVAYALDAGGQPVFVETEPLGGTARGAAVDPTGRYLLTVDGFDDLVRSFRIDRATGALAPASSIALPPGSSPYAVAVHPSGRYAYVAANGTSDVFACAIDATSGALALLATPSFDVGGNPRDLVVEPFGRFLYVASQATNGVERLAIAPATGELTLVGSAAAAGGQVGALAVDVGGTRLFAAVQSTGELRLWGFDAAADGALGLLDATPSGAGARGLALRQRLE